MLEQSKPSSSAHPEGWDVESREGVLPPSALFMFALQERHGRGQEGGMSRREEQSWGWVGSVSVTAQPGLLVRLLCRCSSVCSKRNKQSLSRAGKEVTAIKCSKEDLG